MMRSITGRQFRLGAISLAVISTAWPLAGCALKRSIAADSPVPQTFEAGEAVASDHAATPARETLVRLPTPPKTAVVVAESVEPEAAAAPLTRARNEPPRPTVVTPVALQLPTPPAMTNIDNSGPQPRRFGTVLHGSQATFDREVLQSDAPVLVDFHADWCGPCKRMAPTLQQVATENPNAKIVKINVDHNPELAARYGIQSLPSLVVFKDGRVVRKEKGVVSKDRLKQMLDL